MSDLNLLLVEDDDGAVQDCCDAVKIYNSENAIKIQIEVCKTVEESTEKLSNIFDGAIIDLRLGDVGDGGNQVIEKLHSDFLRISIIILTGTPDAIEKKPNYLGVFTKGNPDAEYKKLFDIFLDVYNTGLTRIMGGRGKIEETLNTVFLQNILPQRNAWIEYGKTSSKKTEKSLLRHILNHLYLKLDEDDPFVPEEVYICPPVLDGLYVGSIINEKGKTAPSFVVLTPACDLVIREGGNFKTDRILLVEIDNFTQHDVKGEIEKRQSNTKELYLHWLPETKQFTGGYLNFRKISTITKAQYEKDYDIPKVQVSPSFTKDIISRFSSFYARQGQPAVKKIS